MRQAYQLEQLQVQRLIMTQSIQQAIAILQMPAVELWEYVQDACTTNPLLEWSDNGSGERKHSVQSSRTGREWGERRSYRGLGSRSDVALQAVYGQGALCDYVQEQLGYLREPNDVLGALRYLLNNLDERGYLTESIEELSELSRLSKTVLEEALLLLQEMEPYGIGARDLRECLLLQLRYKELSPAVQLAKRIVSDHLQDIPGSGSMRAMAALNCSRSEWQAALAVIRTLQPRPGLPYSAEPISYVIPDLTIVRACNRWVVMVNDEALPSVQMSELYQGMANVSAASDAAPMVPAWERSGTADPREYILKNKAAASNLLRSLEARRRTLFRVAEMIAQYQHAFFERGAEHLKPLTMRVVADALLLHESTISRTVSGKYVQTPHGLFELRHFFSSALQTTSGDVTAGKSVCAAIKRIIDQEQKSDPLTDQDLSAKLLQLGIRVSRRTVAKYREEMRIANSSARKLV